MRQVILISVLLLSFPFSGYSFDENYPPFDLKVFKDRMSNAAPINKPYEKGEFRDKDLTISWVTKVPQSSVVEIRYKTKLVAKVELPGSDDHSDFLGEVFYTDIDGNGLSDVIIHPAFYGGGLGSFYKTTIILFQTKPGRFRRLDFTSFYFDPRDFVDLKGSGHYQLLIMQLADGITRHNFWTYSTYRIKDFNLVMDKKSFPSFPKFIQYTERPNNTPTNKLTEKQKIDFLRTLPAVIKSKAVT